MILCDLDGVLATSHGRDTVAGGTIHRTFVCPPEQLRMISEARIPFHILTTKVEIEAWEVLRVIGLDKYVKSVIGADTLLWPSIWSALRKGQVPSYLSKAFYKRAVPNDNGERVVMIEDRRENLLSMFEAGCIDFGILVPKIRVVGEGVVEWCDLARVLQVARELAVAKVDEANWSGLGLNVYRWQRDRLEKLSLDAFRRPCGNSRYLLEVPKVSAVESGTPGVRLQSLDTGYVLTARRLNIVAILRGCRRSFRQIAAGLARVSH